MQTVCSAPFPSSGVVKLNVGGDTFVTTVETLASNSGFFQSLSYEGNAELSKTATVDGGYFFDRDGPSFALILGYLRTNCLPESLTSRELVSHFKNKATYVQTQSSYTTHTANKQSRK